MKKILFGTILAILLMTPMVLADIDTGLIGYWKLDEGTGGTTADATSYGNDGTLGGNVTWVDSELYGNAVDFDTFSGPNPVDHGMAHVDVGNSSIFNVDELTISAWVKYTPYTAGGESSQIIVAKTNDNGNNINYWFGTYNDQVSTFWGIDWDDGLSGNVVMVEDKWYHIVWTVNSTDSVIYINNSIDAQKSTAVALGDTIGNVVIGAHLEDIANEVYNSVNNGTIDEVRIYNRSLTPSDVAELWEYSPTPAKVAQWEFEDGSGSNVYDSIGDNNCTIYGTESWVEGKYGGGVEFDEGTTYLNCDGQSTFNFVGSFAYEYWINTTTDTYTVLGKYNNSDSTSTWAMFHDGDVEKIVIYDDGGIDLTSEGVIEGVNDGTWNHVVSMRNSTHLVTYINGVVDSNSETAADSSYYVDNVYPLLIGHADASDVSNWLGGRIDNVRVWEGTLSADQIMNLYLYDNLTAPCIPNFTLNSSVEQCYNSTHLQVNETYYDINECDGGNLTYSVISGYNLLGYSLTSQADSCYDSDTLRTTYIYNDTETCGYGIVNYTDATCVDQLICSEDVCQADSRVPFITGSAVPGLIMGAGILLTLLSIMVVPPQNTKELTERIVGALIVIAVLVAVSGAW